MVLKASSNKTSAKRLAEALCFSGGGGGVTMPRQTGEAGGFPSAPFSQWENDFPGELCFGARWQNVVTEGRPRGGYVGVTQSPLLRLAVLWAPLGMGRTPCWSRHGPVHIKAPHRVSLATHPYPWTCRPYPWTCRPTGLVLGGLDALRRLVRVL